MLIPFKQLQTVNALIIRDAQRVDGTPATLIDFAAQLRLHIKELQTIEKAVTEQTTGAVILDNETPQGNSANISGVAFYASVTQTIRWTLDTKAVKAEMGEPWYDARCKQGLVRSVKYYDNA
jgi:hypothetical protein